MLRVLVKSPIMQVSGLWHFELIIMLKRSHFHLFELHPSVQVHCTYFYQRAYEESIHILKVRKVRFESGAPKLGWKGGCGPTLILLGWV